MKNRKLRLAMLLVGMSLGTAWAIRGQFGHEQGAAWAGAIGALSVLLVAKRVDWFSKVFSATLAGAIGWGLGGMMSYGVVVGYGRGSDFGNVFYGLLMLFVIGALYGFIGGGLFGLALQNSKKNKVEWVRLTVEMVVGGIIFYFFVVEQFGWKMTPPRSELWAVCFGMALALTSFIVRNKKEASLRVAVYAGLGGGFGFAFGNFLHVIGNVSGIQFNFWNVMEYSLGFFGGLGMAYGTFTAKWEEEPIMDSRKSQLTPLIGVVLIIPFIVWQQSFEFDRIAKMLAEISVPNLDMWQRITQWFSLILVLAFAIFNYRKFSGKQLAQDSWSYNSIKNFYFGFFGVYMILSWFITGAFLSTYRVEQYLYFVNFAILFVLIDQVKVPIISSNNKTKTWASSLIAIIGIIAILAFVAIISHGELKGTQKRFGNATTTVSDK